MLYIQHRSVGSAIDFNLSTIFQECFQKKMFLPITGGGGGGANDYFWGLGELRQRFYPESPWFLVPISPQKSPLVVIAPPPPPYHLNKPHSS